MERQLLIEIVGTNCEKCLIIKSFNNFNMTDIDNILNKSEVSQIKDLYDKINKSEVDRDNKLLSIITTIFAIVITLTTIDINNKLLFYLYLFTLIIFVVSILTGFIKTNTNSHMYRKSLDEYLKHLAEIKTGTKNDTNLIISSSPFYVFISHIFHYSTYLAIISLAVFTILKQIV